MTPTELRLKVAGAMGWTGIRHKSPETYSDAGHYGSPPGKPRRPEPLPDFGAADWSATGAVLDEIDERWGSAYFKIESGVGAWFVEIAPADAWLVEAHDPCRHRAICLAFLEAVAKDKEPNDAR